MPNGPWCFLWQLPKLLSISPSEIILRRLFPVLFVLFAMGLSGASEAQNAAVKVNRAEMIRILGELPSAMPIRQDLQRLGFTGQNLELAVTQAESFYKDPTIAGHIADQVIAAYSNPSFQVEAQGLIWPMVSRGMGHLTLAELRYYYSVEQAMINALPTRECGRAMRGRFSDKQFADAMSRVAARLETGALREFYRIEFKAAKLGAARGPVTLSEATKQTVGAAIDARLDVLMQDDPNAGRMRAAMQNLSRADNKSACQVGRTFYRAVMTLDASNLRNGLLLIGRP